MTMIHGMIMTVVIRGGMKNIFFLEKLPKGRGEGVEVSEF